SPRSSFSRRPSSTVASAAIGDWPDERYGCAAVFSTCLSAVGQAMYASVDEYAFEKPPTTTTLSYDSPKCRITPLPCKPYSQSSSGLRSPTTPKPCESST